MKQFVEMQRNDEIIWCLTAADVNFDPVCVYASIAARAMYIIYCMNTRYRIAKDSSHVYILVRTTYI